MGLIAAYHFFRESFPPASKWSISAIPDQTGRVVLITGANTGLGYETAKALAAKGAKVYLACRSEPKARDAVVRLQNELGGNNGEGDGDGEKRLLLKVLQLDLADLESVKRAVEEFKSKESRLDLLYNNGGIMWAEADQLTAQGYDLIMGTNVLGHFYLSKLLLPLMAESAKTTPAGQVRVITVTSIAHRFAYLNKSHLEDSEARVKSTKGRMGIKPLYDESKLMNIQISGEFARRHGDEGVVFLALNPGNINTKLGENITNARIKRIMYLFCFSPPEKGVLTQLYAGTDPEAGMVNGGYFIPWARRGKISKRARSEKEASELWNMLEGLVKNV